MLNHESNPRFDKFDAGQVVATVRELIAKQDQQLQALEAGSPATWAELVAPMTELAEPLGYAWNVVHHLLGVANDDALRAAEAEIQGEVIAASLRLAQSQPIYRAFKQIRQGAGWEGLEQAQRRIVEAALKAAEDAGIGLEGEARERFSAIETSTAEVGTRFSNNVLDATKAFSLVLTDPADVAGLPPSFLAASARSARIASGEDKAMAAATAEKGPWRISLDGPMMVPFLEHGLRRDLREKIYRASVTRAAIGELDNQPLIQQTLQLRNEKAGLLGFQDYAALSLSRKMAKKVDAVRDLLDRLRTAARAQAHREMDELTEFARQHSGNPSLQLRHWDVAFYAERLREQRYAITDEELRPYFPLDAALRGLFGVAQRLFGVTIEAADGQVPVWHPDVRYFAVKDESGAPVAFFYLDPFTRPENKRGGAWMNGCLDRKVRADGSVRLPVAYLICNQTPPGDDRPSLMTFREVETLFHEFGHGLQHMLTTVKYVDAAGINNVEWDAVELPSQFMENWCYHRDTLMGFARHYKTGAPLPRELFDKIVAARTYRAGSMFLRQVYLGTLDMNLHHGFLPETPDAVLQLQRHVATDNSVLPPLAEDRFLCGFTHIFAGGYAAGYYSYKWAEVLAADAFSAFEEVGLDNADKLAEVGRRFRDTVLAMGGGEDPAKVFRAFRGRDPDPLPLLRTYGLAA